MDGYWDSGTWDSATWDYVPVLIDLDGHDGKRQKKRFDEEKAAKSKRREKVLRAYEIVFEGRPAVAEEIARPFVVPPGRRNPTPSINLEKLLADTKAIERIMREMNDIDDEEALALLW